MASGFFALFDDIAYLLDDVASSAKVATQKTAGILGDDLAVNAQKASGFKPNRELPILFAITKGSFLNKLILLPIVLTLSYFLPILIPIFLMIGGAYLAYEGFEKIYEYLTHKQHHNSTKESMSEEEKIKSAITTDFILSLEIIIIALSAVSDEDIVTKIITVTVVSILATIGVYGIVALIVRMDDIGFAMVKKGGTFNQKVGMGLVNLLPKVIRVLAFVGTVAMLLVAGGIFIHHIEFLHHIFDHFLPFVPDLLVGFGVGAVVFLFKKIVDKIRGNSKNK